MFYSYSCLVLATLSLMTSLFGPESIELKDDKLSTFFSMGFICIFIFLFCWFFFFQNIIMATLYIGTQLLSIFFNRNQWPWSQIFLLFICSFCPVPFFNIIYRNFGTLREKSFMKPNHARYLNPVGASLNMILGIGLFYYQNDKSSLWSIIFFIFFSQSLIGIFVLLETKIDFGLYESAIQNAMGHALASFGWTGRTQLVFAICTALAAGRFLLEFRHISATLPIDRGISDSQHRDADLETITVQP